MSKTATLNDVCFNQLDLQSCGPGQQTRSDAFAVCLNEQIERIKTAFPHLKEFIDKEVCLVDPNVMNLIVNMQRPSLGPIDAVSNASLVFAPIAKFEGEVESGAHWTMLILQRSKKNPKQQQNQNEQEEEEEHVWFQPLHVDSLNNSQAKSSNQEYAEMAAQLLIEGAAEHETKKKQKLNNSASKIKSKFIGSSNNVAGPSPKVVKLSPQQQNGFDCGVFAAMCVGAVLRFACSKGEDDVMGALQNSPVLNADGITVADWGYDQNKVTQFRSEVYKKMDQAWKSAS